MARLILIIVSVIRLIIRKPGPRTAKKADNLTITAVVRVTPNDFPSYFASLVATKLAVEFCMPLISDQTVFRTLVALYENELQTAKFIDSTTSVNTGIENFSLIDSRF